MKGIILAGGSGTRLQPLTKVISKQLLPIYNKPMIYYPLETLKQAGIKDILIIVSPHHSGDFIDLLGSGKDFGVRLSYEIQDKPEGIAQAFLLAENFIGDDSVALILGDNIFQDDFSYALKSFKDGAYIFIKHVFDPERFGVVEIDENNTVLSLEEKPKNPKSSLVQTGLYICDNSVIEKAKNLQPSSRSELEITDVMNMYLEDNTLYANKVEGQWFDAGTFESMFAASSYIRDIH
jgi:glucose-1-phosphate thymidylyltransferase